MAKIQDKLKETIEKQSMKSLERISSLLYDASSPSSQANEPDMITDESSLVVDAAEDTAAVVKASDLKGENKAPFKKARNRKHALRKEMQMKKSVKEEPTKRRPKHFVQF